ncbi:tetratricopeptide repeat protein [Desulfobacterales bacterium HSG2]|nr:tetratricopeptide repeat protein [Desulfobacterales bacterium HSG2]
MEQSKELVKKINELTEMIAIESENTKFYQERGDCYFRLKNYDKAIVDYTQIIKLDPENIDSYTCRAFCYNNLQQYDKAIDEINKAVEMNPDNEHVYLNRGLIYYADMKNYEEAINDFSKSIELNPKSLKAYLLRARCYLEMEEYNGAIDDLTKSIEFNPENTQLYLDRGKSYLHIHNYNRWLYDYNNAFKLDPEYVKEFCKPLLPSHDIDYLNEDSSGYERPDAYSKRALSHLFMKNPEEAINNINKAIEADPERPEFYLFIGVCYLQSQRYDEAINYINSFVNFAPQNAVGYFSQGYCYSQMQEYDRAIIALNKLIELNFTDPTVQLLLTDCYCKTKEEDKSLQKLSLFRKKLEVSPLHKAMFEFMGMKINYGNILGKIVVDSSIDYMLKAMEILLGLKDLGFYNEYYSKLATFMDNIIEIEKGELSEDIFNLGSQIFDYYPKFEYLLKVLERDGKELCFIRTKLCFLRHICDKFEKEISELSNEEKSEKLFNQQADFMYLFFAVTQALDEKNIELVEKKEREKSKLKTSIFQAISHTISNIMLANKSITKRIKNGTNSMNDVNRLELLNNLVLSTMKAIKLAFSREDIVVSKAPYDLSYENIEDGISLHDLLYFCLNINLHYLVSGEGEEGGWETMREIFFFIDDEDEDDMEEKGELFEEMKQSPGFSISELSEESVLAFVKELQSEKFYSIHRFFTFRLDELKSFYVKRDSYTFAVLFIIFLELTKNMLRYGTIEDESARKFVMECTDEDDCFVLTMTNVCEKSDLNLKQSTLQGLAMIQEFSKVVGKFEKIEEDIGDSDFFEFTTKLFIKKPVAA